jgi:lysophospholipase L1-like esterase
MPDLTGVGAPITGLPGLFGSRAVVVLFGDSLTHRGYMNDGWVAALSSYYGRRADVLNRGYGGYNTRYGRHIMQSIFPESISSTETNAYNKQGKYLLTTVFFGANDAAIPGIAAHVPLEEFKENMNAIVVHLKQFFHFVLLISPPPVHEPTRLEFQKIKYGEKATGVVDRTTAIVGEYGKVVKEVASQHNVLFIDIHNLMLQQGPNVWPGFVGVGHPGGDGLHFSREGEAFVAKHIIALIEKQTVAIESLPSELPWGSEVDGNTYIAEFEKHQREELSNKIGLGVNFIGNFASNSGDYSAFPASIQLVTVGLVSLGALIIMFKYFFRKGTVVHLPHTSTTRGHRSVS